MMNDEVRNSENHPIISQNYIVPTPAMEDMLDKTMIWAENMYTGCIMYGYQRLGKSTAIEYTVDEIQAAFDPIMVGIVPMISNIRISESAFWGQILKAFGHSLWSRGTAQVKRDRLFNQLTTFNENVGRKGRAMLFIDDAQKLEDSHFDWLSEIHNDLKLQKLHLMVILVGQPEILNKKNILEQNHKYEIIARFMNEEYQFHGIRNENDIAVILNTYDVNTEYPEGSGRSFTEFYFPQAYEFGWRMEHEAEKIWRMLLQIKNSHKFEEDLLIEELLIEEIHMEYFARTIENLFKQNKTADPGFSGFTDEQIKKAIQNSGYIGGSKYLRYKDILPRSA